MSNDKRGNPIGVCQFESYLAKFFLENAIYFEPLYQKIFSEIDKVINANKNNKLFARYLYTSETQVISDYSHIKNYQDIKTSKSLIIYDTFLKFFCETVLEQTDEIIFPQRLKSKKSTGLDKSTRFTLFGSSKKTVESIGKFIRDDIIFKPSERGCIDVEDIEDDVCLTKKFGILHPEDTPFELQNYFAKHFAAQFAYKPKEDSFVAKWLRKHHLPLISGTSGSAEKTFSQLSKFVEFNREEASQLFLTSAVGMIALGHHSFFEVMLVADKVGLKLEEQNTLLDFYLQCIPQTIQQSPGFKSFIEAETGGKLIKEYHFLSESYGLELKEQAVNNL